jgi:hypothetical protein
MDKYIPVTSKLQEKWQIFRTAIIEATKDKVKSEIPISVLYVYYIPGAVEELDKALKPYPSESDASFSLDMKNELSIYLRIKDGKC